MATSKKIELWVRCVPKNRRASKQKRKFTKILEAVLNYALQRKFKSFDEFTRCAVEEYLKTL